MAGEDLMNGSCPAARCEKLLARLIDDLLQLTGKVDAKKIYAWQQEIRTLIDEMPMIDKKKFFETEGGVQMALLALEKIMDLDEIVARGASALPAEDANRTVGEAMSKMTLEVNTFIDFTRSLM